MAMPVLERVVPILSAPLGHMPRSILENSAITLGRCARLPSWVCLWLLCCEGLACTTASGQLLAASGCSRMLEV